MYIYITRIIIDNQNCEERYKYTLSVFTGEITVFVGCRQRHGDYVEKFNFENSTNTLRHVHTIVDQHMRK